MDPLYANYDKRKKTLDENSAPVPQPTPNSMPVFGAAAAPVMNQAPVAEPASVAEPTPAPAPAVEPVAEPAPVATPVAELDPTIESTPVQDPFAPKPQSNDFQQEFEQLVDGTKPAQLSEPQPQFNPNYTGTGDIVLNLDQPKKKFNTKIIAIIAGIVVITILAVVLIAMGGGKKGGAGNNKQDVTITTYVNYLLNGKESNDAISENESWVASKITKNKQIVAQEGENFFNRLKEMTSVLLEKEKNEEIIEKLKINEEYIEAAQIYDVDREKEKEIYLKFEEEGYDSDSMEKIIEEKFGAYIKSENQYISEYGKNKKEYFDLMSEIFVMTIDAGCTVRKGMVDNGCNKQKMVDSKYEEFIDMMGAASEINKENNSNKERKNREIMECGYEIYTIIMGAKK